MPQTPTPAETPSFFSAEVGYSRRFYFDLNPPKTRFCVVCGGLESCAAGYAIHRQDGFPFPTLEYVLQGAGRICLNGVARDLAAGSVYAYGPGVPIEIVGDAKHPMTKYFVCFAGRGSADLLATAGLQSGGMTEVSPSFALVHMFDELVGAGELGGPRGRALCLSLLQSLLLKLAVSAVPLTDTQSKSYATYRRCRQFAEEHFLRLRSLDAFAQDCGVDRAYLCRLFRNYAHESPYHFLLRLKMHYAANLLQQTHMPVKQAGLTVGFADQMHFSRVFRKILKVAPTALRGIR